MPYMNVFLFLNIFLKFGPIKYFLTNIINYNKYYQTKSAYKQNLSRYKRNNEEK